jgi:hypothetical protein
MGWRYINSTYRFFLEGHDMTGCARPRLRLIYHDCHVRKLHSFLWNRAILLRNGASDEGSLWLL